MLSANKVPNNGGNKSYDEDAALSDERAVSWYLDNCLSRPPSLFRRPRSFDRLVCDADYLPCYLRAGFSKTIGALAPGVNFIQFMYPGIVSMTVLTNSLMSGLSIVWDREFGFLREVLVAR